MLPLCWPLGPAVAWLPAVPLSPPPCAEIVPWGQLFWQYRGPHPTPGGGSLIPATLPSRAGGWEHWRARHAAEASGEECFAATTALALGLGPWPQLQGGGYACLHPPPNVAAEAGEPPVVHATGQPGVH